MIKFSHISFMRGPEVLLEPTSLEIFPGQKAAFIGANGCGKSSLFALIQGELSPESGSLHIPKDWRVVSVAQHSPHTEDSILAYTIAGDKRLMSLRTQLEQAEAGNHGADIARLHDELAVAGHYDVEARAATILAGLGFTQEQLNAPVNAFSGGWKMRINLARALLCPSDVLMLDEPTNHLDLDAVIWLEKWLQRFAGTLLFISHDKHFIDAIAGQILSFEQRQLIAYSGNYSAFERQKAERLRLQALEYDKQQAQIEHLNKFITRFKAKASKAKQAQSRVKQLDKMELLAPVQAQNPFRFAFDDPEALPDPLIQMRNITVGYGEKVVLDEVKLNLVPGSRLGLLGRNGAGKSTLIKLLANVHGPLAGEFVSSKGVQLGYFAQHQIDVLDSEATPLLHLQRIDAQATEQQLRDFLGGFGFGGDAATSKVAPFSGGEKARLALAIIVYQKPNLLLLDEPTNHLDLAMRDALNFALQGFAGAMVLVAHDRTLLEAVCDEYYLVDSGVVEPFNGDLDAYTKWVLAEAKEEKKEQQSQSANTQPSVDRKAQKRKQAEFRQATSGLRNTIKHSESQMQQLETALQAIENALSDPNIYYKEQKSQLTEILTKQASLKQQYEAAEAAWFDATDTLEQMSAEFDVAH